jgi:hypothetical protein
MTVKKKASKNKSHQYNVDEIINRGGKTSAENSSPEVDLAETRFTLRIPNKMIDKIDKDREKRIGNVSRNQWILEAIAEQFDSK